MTTWKERLDAAVQRSDSAHAHHYGPPVESEQLVALAEKFGPLPVDLRSLLQEFDGVVDEHSDSLIWNANEIIEQNDGLRAIQDEEDDPLPYDHFLLFAGNGCGDYFGFCLKVPEYESPERDMCPGNIPGPIVFGDIIALMHESYSIIRFAPNLAEFIDGWFSGERVT
jgi:hypothetical protein